MTTVTLSAADCCAPRTRRLPVLRRLVLATGLALVAWSRRPQRLVSHEVQARSIQAELARVRAAEPFRYGIAQ